MSLGSSQVQPRRTKVEGRQYTGIYRSSSGRLEIAYRAGGRLQWFSCPRGWSLTDAKNKRDELSVAKAKGELASPSKLTVGEAARKWLDEYADDWAPNTRSSRESIIRLHVISVIGNVKLRDLTADHVWKVVTVMGEKGAAKSTRKLALTVISALCTWLVEDTKELRANPVAALSKTRRKRLSDDGTQKQQLKVIDDQSALLQEVREPYYLIVKVALLTGLRLAEVLGLRVRDIDDHHLHVNGQLDRPTRSFVSRVKTPSARRSVILPAALRLELLASLPDNAGPDGLVFRARDGRGHWAQSVERGFASAAKRAKLDESLTFHATRHTFASRLISEGRPVTFVQQQLGHSSPKLTMDIYAHLFDRATHETAAREAADAAYAELTPPKLRVVP